MTKEACELFLAETEQAFQKMGLDFYEIMRQVPAIVERLKPYHQTAQKVWENARNREDALRFLLEAPDSALPPDQFEKILGFVRIIPYFLRSCLQEAAKSLPPSPGGRPRELDPNERRDVCAQIGSLYGQGVLLADAKKRMGQRHGVSLRTIDRIWQARLHQTSGLTASIPTTGQ